MKDLRFFYRSFKGHFYGKQFLRQICEIYVPDLHSSHWSFPNRSEDRNVDERRLNGKVIHLQSNFRKGHIADRISYLFI